MTTPYMALTLPTPGVTQGPDWATLLNTALEAVDAHDHTEGKGTLVPTNGLNINAHVPFGGYDAEGLRAARFGNQGSALDSSLARSVYVQGGELHFIDSSGNDVAITSGGSVAGAAGNITGLTSPAALTWDGTNKKFIFTQDSNFPAKLQAGDIVLYETISSPTNAITIKSPAGLGAAYSLTLPAAVPATSALAYLTTGGVMTLLGAPGASTSLLQQTTGGTLSWVTTLPSGLTLPTPSISNPTVTGAIVLGTSSSDSLTLGSAIWPRFRAYTGSDYTADTQALRFNTEVFDIGGYYSTSIYRFAPAACATGYYRASVNLTWGSSAVHTLILSKTGGGFAGLYTSPTFASANFTGTSIGLTEQFYLDGTPLSAKTFETTDVSTGSDTITLTGAGFAHGLQVRFTTGGSLPTGISAGTDYYLYVTGSTDVWQLTTTPYDITTLVDITTTGAGTHTCTPQHGDWLDARTISAGTIKGIGATALISAFSAERVA